MLEIVLLKLNGTGVMSSEISWVEAFICTGLSVITPDNKKKEKIEKWLVF